MAPALVATCVWAAPCQPLRRQCQGPACGKGAVCPRSCRETLPRPLPSALGHPIGAKKAVFSPVGLRDAPHALQIKSWLTNPMCSCLGGFQLLSGP